MANEDEDSTQSAPTEEWLLARKKISEWLSGKGRAQNVGSAGRRMMVDPPRMGELGADDEALADDALDRWIKDQVHPILCAARALADWRKRQRRDRETVADQAVALTGRERHDEDPAIARYTEDEEPELKAATRRHCEARFREAFGVSWLSENDALVAKLEAESGPHDAVEKEAQAILFALRDALRSADRLAARAPRDTTGNPTVGGWGMRMLARLPAAKLLDAIESQAPPGYLVSTVHKFAAFSKVEDFQARLGIGREPNYQELTDILILAGWWREAREWGDGLSVKAWLKGARATAKKALEPYEEWIAKR